MDISLHHVTYLIKIDIWNLMEKELIFLQQCMFGFLKTKNVRVALKVCCKNFTKSLFLSEAKIGNHDFIQPSYHPNFLLVCMKN